MSNINDKIDQCKQDIESLQANLKKLEEEKSQEFNWDDYTCGSVFKTWYERKRLIVRIDCKLYVVDAADGDVVHAATRALQTKNKSHFEDYGYEKINRKDALC